MIVGAIMGTAIGRGTRRASTVPPTRGGTNQLYPSLPSGTLPRGRSVSPDNVNPTPSSTGPSESNTDAGGPALLSRRAFGMAALGLAARGLQRSELPTAQTVGHTVRNGNTAAGLAFRAPAIAETTQKTLTGSPIDRRLFTRAVGLMTILNGFGRSMHAGSSVTGATIRAFPL